MASDSSATRVMVAISPMLRLRRAGENSSAVRAGTTTVVGAAAAVEVIPR